MRFKAIYIVLAILFLIPLGLHANFMKNLEFDFGAKAGYLSHNEEAAKDIYDGGLVLGLEGIVWTRSGLGLGLEVDRFAADGKPKSSGVYIEGISPTKAKSEISIIPVTLTTFYRVKKQSSILNPYIGIGIGLYFLDEELKISYDDHSDTWSNSGKGIGFHWLAGVQYKIFTVEVKYSTAKVDGNENLVGDSADIGGFNVLAGVRF